MKRDKKIPRHVAIIMDGNGRWAAQQGKERPYGHMQGVEPVRCAVRAAIRHGVEYLTLYAFSTENWGRPADEVDALLGLLCRCIVDETPELCRQGVRIRVIGDRERFPEEVREYLDRAEELTREGRKLTLILALNYSSRSEIAQAARRLAEEVAAGRLASGAVDEAAVSGVLYTAFCPDPDLIVRTSGEHRLSNFLLWQASYAELWFPEVLWPDFTEKDFDEAIAEYMRRERRFGLV